MKDAVQVKELAYYKACFPNKIESLSHSWYAEARTPAAQAVKQFKMLFGKNFGHKLDSIYWQTKQLFWQTIKSSTGGLYVCAGGLCVCAGEGGLTFNFDKNSTDL